MKADKTIAIIGGGSAGFTAAETAARLGARVLFFVGNRGDHASLCVNAGCMPSKALFQVIDEMHHARSRSWLSIKPEHPKEYLAQLVAWKDHEIARFRECREKDIRHHESSKFTIIRANACFVDAHTLESQRKQYTADAIILATGSTPIYPPIDGLEALRNAVWTSEEILNNTKLPESLAVIGGGAVGLEFSLRYMRLGSNVTVLSRGRLLPGYDARYGERLATIYQHEGVSVLANQTVTRIGRNTQGWFIITTEGAGGSRQIISERVLLAAGRRPMVDDLNLEAIGVVTGEDGCLPISDDMRVAGQEHIFAAGDITGRRMVVHDAHIEADIAAENAVTAGARRWLRQTNLRVIFSDPEFAFAGMSVEEARCAGHKVATAMEESSNVGKLHLVGDNAGFGELIADEQSHRLLGAGLLCVDASELIHLPAYAIAHEQTVRELANAEYYHPTKIEIISNLADTLSRQLGDIPHSRAAE